MYVSTYTPETLERAEVDRQAGPMVLEFGANWCGHCNGAQPHIQAAFEQAGSEVLHVKVEDGSGRPLGRSYRVKLWPTLIFLQNGQELARVVRPDNVQAVLDGLKKLQTG